MNQYQEDLYTFLNKKYGNLSYLEPTINFVIMSNWVQILPIMTSNKKLQLLLDNIRIRTFFITQDAHMLKNVSSDLLQQLQVVHSKDKSHVSPKMSTECYRFILKQIPQKYHKIFMTTIDKKASHQIQKAEIILGHFDLLPRKQIQHRS
jgi:hypothetical protein